MSQRPVRRDALGPRVPITLSEQDGVRYLHFGSQWVQGAMRLSSPFALEIDYVRNMMAWLLVMDPPARILQLGLGAAALTNFCWRRCGSTEVTVVENSVDVIEAAYRWFALPRDAERLDVVHADAGAWIGDPACRGRFGVIQVDAYDAEARGPVLDSAAFYVRCRRALAGPGVLVVNLFGDDAGFGDSFDRISAAFDGRVIALDPVPAGNRVVMAVCGPRLETPAVALQQRAQRIERLWRLPANEWAAQALRASGASGSLAAETFRL